MISINYFKPSGQFVGMELEYTPLNSEKIVQCWLFKDEKEAIFYWSKNVYHDLCIIAEHYVRHQKLISPFYFKRPNVYNTRYEKYQNHYWKLLDRAKAVQVQKNPNIKEFLIHYRPFLKHMSGTLPPHADHNYAECLKMYGEAHKMYHQLKEKVEKYGL